MAAPEPSVESPGEAVEKIVFRVGRPAVEHDHGRTVGNVVAILVGDEKQMRRVADPDPAKANLKSAQVICLSPEDLFRIEMAVIVGVFEDGDAVLGFAFPFDVGETFGDPEPAPVVVINRDGLSDVRLAGEERDLEALGDGDELARLLGRGRGVGGVLSVGDAGREVVRRGEPESRGSQQGVEATNGGFHDRLIHDWPAHGESG